MQLNPRQIVHGSSHTCCRRNYFPLLETASGPLRQGSLQLGRLGDGDASIRTVVIGSAIPPLAVPRRDRAALATAFSGPKAVLKSSHPTGAI